MSSREREGGIGICLALYFGGLVTFEEGRARDDGEEEEESGEGGERRKQIDLFK